MKDNFIQMQYQNIKNDNKKNESNSKTEDAMEFFKKALKIYQNKAEIPENLIESDILKNPFEIMNDLNLDEKKQILDKIKEKYNKFCTEEYEIAKKYWSSMNYIIPFLYDERKKNLLNNKEILSLLENYKSEEEIKQIESEIKNNIASEDLSNEDKIFWKNSYEILNFLKNKKIIEDLYNNSVSKISNLNNDSNEDDDEDSATVVIDRNLSPPLYESDEELRKNAVNEGDYLFQLNQNRNKILQNKIKEFREKRNNNNENDKEDNNIKIKNNKYLDFLNKTKNKIINKNNSNISINSSNSENNDNNNNLNYKDEENSDQEAINYLNRISGHKNKNKLEKSNYIEENNNKYETSNNIFFDMSLQDNDEMYYDIKDQNYLNFNIDKCDNEETIEIDFKDTIDLKKKYEWEDKYKPIKPQFSNKVIMGFEWNKYNQAHYNKCNLPPKMIHGYKFNIFYPNLIDRTKTPNYFIERCDIPEMCIIRFKSGPPYEDIAFKIANKEWDKGFRTEFINVFDKGVLKLYFMFKKFRYKR